MAARVHLTHPPEDLAPLASLLDPAIELTTGLQMPAGGADVIVSGRPDPEMVDGAKMVVVPWAGIPEETLDLVRKNPGLRLHNLHHNAPQVAELAVGLLFATAKAIIPYDQTLRAGDWRLRYQPTRATLLYGKTAVVLGYGAIGRHIGQILHGIGMRVIGVNRTGTGEPGKADELRPISALKETLPSASALLVSLPLTDETRGLLDQNRLADLPEGALIVNIGRGPIIDEWALYEGLKNGQLGGAGLDVWWNYPPDPEARSSTYPSSAPLHELDNVVMSPHRAGSVKERSEGWTAALASLLNAYARGEEVPNQVDIEKGY